MPPVKKTEPEPTPRQCYAYNRGLQRCEKHANHVLATDDEQMARHGFTVSWSDDECWTPDMGGSIISNPTLQQPTFTGPLLMEQLVNDEDDDMSQPGGPCFICKCSEAAHTWIDEDGDTIDQCEKHGCRTYMP